MSFRVLITRSARDELRRLNATLIAYDLATALRAREALAKGFALLSDFPFTCRKSVPDSPFLRELLITFGSAGYVALFEIEATTVTVLAVRDQREDDYL